MPSLHKMLVTKGVGKSRTLDLITGKRVAANGRLLFLASDQRQQQGKGEKKQAKTITHWPSAQLQEWPRGG